MHSTVSQEDAGTTVEDYLAKVCPERSRSARKKLIGAKLVFVDGRPARAKAKLPAGAVVELRSSLDDEPASEALNVLAENEFLIAVNKPAGVPSTPNPRGSPHCVASQLLKRFPELKEVGYAPGEAGLLHRLDTQTSGVLVAARSQEHFQYFRSELQSGTLAKTYLALSASSPPGRRGLIRSSFSPRGEKVSALPAQAGTPTFETLYEVLAKFPILENGLDLPSCSLIRAWASPAYRHQIRAHLASVGAPLLDDHHYGGIQVSEEERHALHAESVRLSLPNGQPLTIFASLPHELRDYLPKKYAQDLSSFSSNDSNRQHSGP